MHLTLLRHAQTEGSLRNLYYGASDIPALEESLKELAAQTRHYPRAARYYTSGLQRTEQTLRAIYGDVPHTAVPGLQEMNFGVFEMRSEEELQTDPLFIEWQKDSWQLPCPGGESAPQLRARNIAAMEPIVTAGEDAVCILHGGVIAGLMCHFFGGEELRPYYCQPGSGYTVTFADGNPVGYERIPQIKNGGR